MDIILNPTKKSFMIYVSSLDATKLIHLAQKVQATLLMTKEVIVLKKYLNYANVFLKRSAMELLKRLDINKLVIYLKVIFSSF